MTNRTANVTFVVWQCRGPPGPRISAAEWLLLYIWTMHKHSEITRPDRNHDWNRMLVLCTPQASPCVATFKMCFVMHLRQLLPSVPHAHIDSTVKEDGGAVLRGWGQDLSTTFTAIWVLRRVSISYSQQNRDLKQSALVTETGQVNSVFALWPCMYFF